MFDIWQEIYSTIRRNKLRTALTGFAIAWGIFMLIVLLGAGNGLIHAFSAETERQDYNSMKIFPGRTTKAFDGLKEGRSIEFDNRDVTSTQEQFHNTVKEIGANVRQSSQTVSFGPEYINIGLTGVYPNTLELESFWHYRGRFLNELDLKERRKVIVLHKRTAEVLFDKSKTDPIGQLVNVNGNMFKVVGLYNSNATSADNNGLIPYTTLQIIYNKGDKLNNFAFTTKGLEDMASSEAFEEDMRKMLGSRHRFDPTDDSAVWIWNRFKQYLQSQGAMSILSTAIWVIGIFTLLSGIVGVYNIMLITVKERTREFGIRKALGAKPRSILFLIIVESVFITTFFGYIGMVAGIGATEWMDSAFGNQTMDNGMWSSTVFSDPTVDLKIAIQATVTLIIAGTLAGFFPARKAVRISPIEALRAD